MFDKVAKDHGVMLLAGPSFAVIPSECLIGYLIKKIDVPQKLSLFISGHDTVSRGTAKGGFEIFKTGIRCRQNGVLTKVKNLSSRTIDFGEGETACVPMIWPDLYTAHRSSGIENIYVFVQANKLRKKFIFLMKYFRLIFALPIIQNLLGKRIDTWPEGPTVEEQNADKVIFIAVVEDNKGNVVSATLTTPEAYRTTYLTTLKAVKEVIKGKVKSGYQTPYLLFGHRFIYDMKGYVLEDIK